MSKLHRVAALAALSSALLLAAACGGGQAPAPTAAPAKPAEATKAPAAAPTTAPAAAPTAAKPAEATKAPAAASPAAAAPSGPITKPGGYPTKAVQVIVPFDPGGGADNSQRVFNKYAEPIVGQQMPIVNKPGAGGATGWAELVRTKPDGYTMAVVTPPFNIIPALLQPKQTGYTLDQFAYASIYAIVPDALYVKEDSQFKTAKDLQDYAKANPDKIKAANTGTLGADHLTTLLIEDAMGVKFTAVPFTGGAQSLQATLGGTTDVMVASANYIQAQKGKLRALGIATEKRDVQFPDTPTFKEQGFDVLSERYRAFGGPQGLPKEIVDYWGQVSQQIVANPEFKAEMDKQGQPAAFLGPADATARIKKMTDDIQKLSTKLNLVQK